MTSEVLSARETVEAVAELAYRFWEERGCPEGSPEEDWYKAEFTIEQEQDRERENLKPLETPAEPALQTAKTANQGAR